MKLHDVVRVKVTGALGTIVYIYNGKCAVELFLGNCVEDFSMGELEVCSKNAPEGA